MDSRRLQSLRQKATKSRTNQPAGAFFQLGSRSDADATSAATASSSGTTVGSAAPKRSALTGSLKRPESSGITTSSQASKKPKLDPVVAASTSGFNLLAHNQTTGSPQTQISRRDPTNDSAWLALATRKVVPLTLHDDLLSAASDDSDQDAIVSLVCGVAKLLVERRRAGRQIDALVSSALCHFAKSHPTVLRSSDTMIDALTSVLKQFPNESRNSKAFDTPLLIIGILQWAFDSVNDWPPIFVKVYLDDALGDRVWVDRLECKQFVRSLLTAFDTVSPSEETLSFIQRGGLEGGAVRSSGVAGDSKDTGGGSTPTTTPTIPQIPTEMHELQTPATLRFSSSSREECRRYAVELLQEWWSKRGGGGGGDASAPKSLLRTMACCCGIALVRREAGPRLDAWLQNTKLQKCAMELLVYVLVNCEAAETEMQVEIMSCLTRLRALKSGFVMNVFNQGLHELLRRHADAMPSVVRLVVHNELSATRMSFNGQILSQCFQTDQQRALQSLASIILDAMLKSEDHLRPIRVFLRDLCRSVLRGEFSMVKLAVALVDKSTEIPIGAVEVVSEPLAQIIDLITMCCFLGVTTAVKDAWQARKDMAVVRRFWSELVHLWEVGIRWLVDNASLVFSTGVSELWRAIHRLFYLGQHDYFSSIDGWPPEQSRSVFLKVIGEAPLSEELLLYLLDAAAVGKASMEAVHVLEFIEQLLRRIALAIPAGSSIGEFDLLPLTSTDAVGRLFKLCAYIPPVAVQFPDGYEMPSVAVCDPYWKAWRVLFALAVYNPETIGRHCWDYLPTLRSLMEMAMTGEFVFPPSCGSDRENVRAIDTERVVSERAAILELENYLAKPRTVDESNSYLQKLCMELQPGGPARKPPDEFLAELEEFSSKANLGPLLCQSRKPDFLLSMIVDQGAGRSLPWVKKLIESNEGSLSVLPVQCLCEFMLDQITVNAATVDPTFPLEDDNDNKPTGDEGERRMRQLKSPDRRKSTSFSKTDRLDDIKQRLCEVLLHQNSGGADAFQQCAGYLLRRLSAERAHERNAVVQMLAQLLLSPSSTQTSVDALPAVLDTLQELPLFPGFRATAVQLLRDALLTETEPSRVLAIAQFVTQSALSDNETEVDLETVSELSHLVVDRRALMKRAFPVLDGARLDGVSRQVMDALLCVYARYLRAELKKAADGAKGVAWSSKQDEIRVSWHKEGVTCVFPVRCVSAMTLLLASPEPIKCTDDNEEAISSFQYLFSSWLSSKPTAYLVDILEEAELFPDWLNVSLLMSSSEKIARFVVEENGPLDFAQIALFLQVFGLPLFSAQLLLKSLDNQNFTALDTLITADTLSIDLVDKCRCAVLAHNKRGATGGASFLAWAKKLKKPALPEESVESMDTTEPVLSKPFLRYLSQHDQQSLPVDQIRNAFDDSSTASWCKLLPVLVKEVGTGTSSSKFALAVCEEVTKDLHGYCSRVPQRISTFIEILKQSKDTSLATPLQNIISAFEGRSVGNVKYDRDQRQSNGSRTLEIDSKQKTIPSILKRLQTSDVEAGEASSLLEMYLQMDSQIASVHTELQLKALFGKNGFKGRKYLLGLLPHRVNTDFLLGIVDNLMESYDTSLDANSVLTLVSSCLKLPRMWTGRDRILARHSKLEDAMGFTDDKLRVLTCFACDSKLTGEWSSVEKKLDLLSLCAPTEAKLKMIANSLFDRCQHSSDKPAEQLLSGLYFSRPNLLISLERNESLMKRIQLLSTSHGTDSFNKLDRFLDGVIAEMFRLGSTSVADRSSRAAMDVRLQAVCSLLNAMAGTHPTLVCRQLHLFSAHLRGVASLSLRALQWTNYLRVFSRLLKLLPLLAPHCYQEPFRADYEAVLDNFMQLIHYHCVRNKNLMSYVTDTLDILLDYLSGNNEAAVEFIEKYTSLFQVLMLRYPDVPHARRLATAMSSPSLQAPLTQEEIENFLRTTPSLDEIKPIYCSPPVRIAPQQLRPLIETLRSTPFVADCRVALRDLHEISYDHPDSLSLFFVDLLPVAFGSDDDECRRSAYQMLVRHLQEQPKDIDKMLDGYTVALLSAADVNTAQLETAVEFLPAFAAAAASVDGSREAGRRMLESAVRHIVGRPVSVTAVRRLEDALSALRHGYVVTAQR